MKADNLGKLLATELARNKKQTLVLGIVSLVAIYFWWPLVLRMTGLAESQANSGPTPTASVEVVSSDATAEFVVTDPTSAAAVTSWRQQFAWLKSDSLMRPGPVYDDLRDPFQDPQIVSEDVADASPREDRKPELKTLAPSPQALGLQLVSVWISNEVRLARINGKNYREGDWVHAKMIPGTRDQDAQSVFSFQVVRIDTQQVALRHAGQSFVLSLATHPRRGAGKIEIYPVAG